jgi:uncharacterized membrane protein
MLPHISLTTNVLVLATFGFMLVVGLFLGLEKIRIMALSIYVGLVLAGSLGDVAYDQTISHGLNFTPGKVKLVLFTLPILLLSLASTKARHKKGSPILITVLSLLVGALIVSSVLFLMDGDMAAKILGDSTIATLLYKFRLVWLGAVPVIAVIASFTGGSKKH